MLWRLYRCVYSSRREPRRAGTLLFRDDYAVLRKPSTVILAKCERSGGPRFSLPGCTPALEGELLLESNCGLLSTRS